MLDHIKKTFLGFYFFSMYEWYACMCVYSPHAWLVLSEVKIASDYLRLELWVVWATVYCDLILCSLQEPRVLLTTNSSLCLSKMFLKIRWQAAFFSLKWLTEVEMACFDVSAFPLTLGVGPGWMLLPYQSYVWGIGEICIYMTVWRHMILLFFANHPFINMISNTCTHTWKTMRKMKAKTPPMTSTKEDCLETSGTLKFGKIRTCIWI